MQYILSSNQSAYSGRNVTMASSDATISMRIPSEIKKRLEEVSRRTRRSRSYLTIEALKKYLTEIEQKELNTPIKGKLEIALSLVGAAERHGIKPKTAGEIDISVRDFRSDA